MTTDALVRNRDAIIGEWDGKLITPEAIATEAHAHLRRWEPWVRASVFDFDLVSHLRFHQEEDGTCAVWYFPDARPGKEGAWSISGKKLATLLAPDREFFAQQLEHVHQQADLREDRASEILAQVGLPIPFWTAIVNLHPTRTAKTLELLETALRLANFVHQRFKHALACNRPLEYSSQLQPMILTPGHGSFPSGHSTEAFTVANVLVRFLDLSAKDTMWEQLMRQAARIAINRQIAGVHFPADSAAGQVLGSAIAEYFLFRCGEGTPRSWSFKPAEFGAKSDFDWRELHKRLEKAGVKPGAKSDLPPGPLEWLWKEAKKEFKP
jgi:hypothetical protein